MIVELTERTMPYFATVAPSDILEMIPFSECHGFGSIQTEDPHAPDAEGCIIFLVLYKKVIRVIWHYVDEGCRCQEVGEDLLEAVKAYAKQLGSTEIQLAFPIRYCMEETYPELLSYYTHRGYSESKNPMIRPFEFFFTLEEAQKFPIMQANIPLTGVSPLKDIPSSELRTKIYELLPDGVKDYGIITYTRVDERISCAMKKDGKIVALFFLWHTGDSIRSAFLLNQDKNPAVVLALARFAAIEAMKIYRPDTIVHIIPSKSGDDFIKGISAILPSIDPIRGHAAILKL